MRVHADRNRCIGAGNCVLAAPSHFDQDDSDGIVVVLEAAFSEDPAVLHAVERCPVGALSIEAE